MKTKTKRTKRKKTKEEEKLKKKNKKTRKTKKMKTKTKTKRRGNRRIPRSSPLVSPAQLSGSPPLGPGGARTLDKQATNN